MCGAPALAGQTVKRDVALRWGLRRAGVNEMGPRSRLTHLKRANRRNHRNRMISREPIRASDLAWRMAELKVLREIVRRAESYFDSEVRPLAIARTRVVSSFRVLPSRKGIAPDRRLRF